MEEIRTFLATLNTDDNRVANVLSLVQDYRVFDLELIQPFEKWNDSAKWLKTLVKENNHEHYPNQCNRRAIRAICSSVLDNRQKRL